MAGKSKIDILSKLDPNNQWRVKDLSQLDNFIGLLQANSRIPVKLTQKFKGDLEGKINAKLKDAQDLALKLKQSQESVEGDTSMAEIQKTTAIVEPIFIMGLKEIINEQKSIE